MSLQLEVIAAINWSDMCNHAVLSLCDKVTKKIGEVTLLLSSSSRVGFNVPPNTL